MKLPLNSMDSCIYYAAFSVALLYGYIYVCACVYAAKKKIRVNRQFVLDAACVAAA